MVVIVLSYELSGERSRADVTSLEAKEQLPNSAMIIMSDITDFTPTCAIAMSRNCFRADLCSGDRLTLGFRVIVIDPCLVESRNKLRWTSVVLALQEFAELPSPAEVNPGETAKLACLVRDRGGECVWLRDGRVVGRITGKYSFQRDPPDGDCGITIHSAGLEEDDGLWECQVTQVSVTEATLTSPQIRLTVRVVECSPATRAPRMHQVELAEEHRARIENRQMCQVQMLIRQNHCRDLRRYNAPSNPSDRPDLVARVFNLKLQQLLHEIVSQHVLGVVIARVHVVEFQKRGLPHAHMLFMLREEDKPRDRDAIDRLVCAEIPSPTMQVQLYDMVRKHMIRDDGQTFVVGTHEVDNRWVVPYNPYLLVRFIAHINVEVCASVKSVKYLFKYVYKGHDRAEVEVSVGELDMESRAHDEIKTFLDARYSFEDLRTVDDIVCSTFKEAAQRRGLLADDSEWDACLAEAALFQMPCQLRQLFATILIYNNPTDPVSLWTKYKGYLSEDFSSATSDAAAEQMTLRELEFQLRENRLSCHHYGLPAPLTPLLDSGEDHLDVNAELQIGTEMYRSLTPDQKSIVDTIVDSLNVNPRCFFIDGPGGTGKTYVYNTLIHCVRAVGKIVIPLASTGIAATLLSGGQTVHSRFKLPIPLLENSVAAISANSSEAELIRRSSLIIWDEAPMAHYRALEIVDRLLKDIMHCDLAFGGKVLFLEVTFAKCYLWYLELQELKLLLLALSKASYGHCL
ncbi:hypothetical protein LAZ67_20000935 [Cordylochernes scorpioides]|uniref:ATP-dependent DNA helicase n=1 Tax=Cordylochernes scorpioides TaxID=51811 RepID=A0ABY6LME3_9ARAC|nr:hypothetical protein LAZ67_20000935 [Cordylochernes scorpioides]